MTNQESKEDSKQDSKKVLIPFVMEIVPIVDIENKRIEINPPLGLFDL